MHGGDRAGAQGHGQIGRVLVRVKAKAGHPFLCVLGANGLKNTNGDHVFRLGQACAHGHRTVESTIVIFGLPRLSPRCGGSKKQGRVIDHGGRCEAFFKRCRIDEGLETRTWLAPSLGHVVELALAKIKPAHQRLDGTAAGVDRHKSAFHLGQLRDFPGVLGGFHDTNDGTSAQLDVGRSLVAQARLGGLEAFPRDFDAVPTLAHCHDLARCRLQHHGRDQIAVVRMVCQRVVNGFLQFLPACGQVHEFFRSPVFLSAFVIHDAPAQCLISRVLLCRVEGGVDVQAACIGFVAVLRKNQLPRHFCNVLGVHTGVVRAGSDLELLGARFSCLLRRDEVVVFHPVNDVELPYARAFRVTDRVVGGRCLGQARQHRGLCH